MSPSLTMAMIPSLKDGSLDNEDEDHGVEELMADIDDISNKESQFKDSSYNCLVKRCC